MSTKKIFPWKGLDIWTMKTEADNIIISASLSGENEAKVFRFKKDKMLNEVYEEIHKSLSIKK